MTTPPPEAAATPPTVARRIVALTRATQRKLEPAVALVDRALALAGHEFPPGRSTAPDDPLPLKSAKLVELLQATFTDDRAGAGRTASLVGRFHAATETLAAAEAALSRDEVLPEATIATLKAAAQFLSRFHEAVGDDALLAQLFPPPALLQADAGHAR